MTRKESLKKLRDVLITRREALMKAIAGDMSMLQQINDQSSGDFGDNAMEAVQDDISSRMVNIHSDEVKSIGLALARFAQNKYGICVSCEKDISMARLEALPYAIRCIHCQSEFEASGQTEEENDDWTKLKDFERDDN